MVFWYTRQQCMAYLSQNIYMIKGGACDIILYHLLYTNISIDILGKDQLQWNLVIKRSDTVEPLYKGWI